MKKPSTPCKNECRALTTESGARGSDQPLPPEHLPCVWREFEPHVRRTVIRALLRLPLGRICANLQASGVAIRRDPALVRHDLIRSASEVDDLVQDVARAMVSAVARGKLFAARPAIYRWVEQTVYWLVPERSRHAAVTALTGALFALRPANDNDSAESEPAGNLVFGSGESPEELLEQREDADARLRRLTAAQREVLERSAQGMDTAATARDLGISEVAVRLRLMHARRRLAN